MNRILVTLSAVFFFSSCLVHEENLPDTDPDFVAAICCTKTEICTDAADADAGKVNWLPSDEIVLTGVAGVPVRYGIKSIYDDGSALFVKKNKEPSVGSGPYVAVYGMDSLLEQEYAPKAGNLPMKAESPNTVLTFSTVCGLLKIRLQCEDTRIRKIIVGSNTGGRYTLNCESPVNISEGADFFIALPEGKYNEFVIIDDKDKACIKKAKQGKETEIKTNAISSLSFVSSLSFIYSLNCLDAEVKADGSLDIALCSVCMNCKVGSDAYSVVPLDEASGDQGRAFLIKGKDRLVYFSGTMDWSQSSANTLRAEIRVKCEKEVGNVELCPKIAVPHQDYPYAGWTSTSESFRLGQTGFYKSFLSDSVGVHLSDSQCLSFRFAGNADVRVLNGSQQTGLWYIKFGLNEFKTEYEAGDTSLFTFELFSPQGVRLSLFDKYEINENEEWVRFENIKDILSGSALDFSSMGLQDAPAGKYGWLKTVKGGFEFEGKPGVRQRFCGANLCSSSNFISHKLADELATRFAALGYNAVRIHHHDKDLFSGSNWDCLDYLLSRFFEKGIYVTTDLFVSRNVRYSDLGLEGSGYMTKGLYKNLIGCYEPAFEDWCRFVKTFMEHVNPYTGRAYKDEPGIPLICLVNEGRLGGCGEKGCPPIQKAWEEYGGEGALAWNSPGFDDFEEYLSGEVFRKCSAYVTSLGVKALLSNDNNGHRHGDMEGNTPLYDYVDNHFYIDYPSAIDGRYAVPATCTNVNLANEGGPEMLRREYVLTAQKPYTITEWNWCGPNRFRGMSGMMIGAMAGIGGWDGIWRFAYSHLAADVGYNPESYPSAVNLATDPLNLASERATVCLYLRDDISGNGEIAFDKTEGTMKVVSDRTCGLYLKNGTSSAGPIDATVPDTPASIWVSSLDMKPITVSERMLLVHITDVQGENVKFGNSERSMILSWGKGTLIEKGTAEISVSVLSSSGWHVYELASDGERIREIQSFAEGGKLHFSVSTGGPSGGRMYYELTRI